MGQVLTDTLVIWTCNKVIKIYKKEVDKEPVEESIMSPWQNSLVNNVWGDTMEGDRFH